MSKLAVSIMRYIVLCLLLASQAWAVSPIATASAMVGSTGSTTVATGADTFFPISGVNPVGFQTDTSGTALTSLVISFMQNGFGISQTWSNLFCFAGTAPGVGKSYKIGPYIGIDFANTCTISGTATTCSDTSNSQSTAAFGGPVTIRVVPAGTPAASTIGCYIENVAN